MKPGQLSRADLLVALAEGDQQLGNRIGRELGLRYEAGETTRFAIQSASITVTGQPVSFTPVLNRSPTAQLTARYLQLVRYASLKDAAERRKQEQEKRKETVISTRPVAWQNRPEVPPVYPALTSLEDLRTRLFPWLALDCQGGRSIDLPVLIDKLSRAEFPGRLPVTAQQQSLDALQIIDDRQVHLTPFWSDHTWLTLHLYDTFGSGQISRAVITNGDTEPRQISRDFVLQPFRLPPTGTPVLLLSDLGRLSQQAGREPRSFNRRQQQYQQLVQCLLRNGNPITLLTPCAPADYPALVRRQIRCLSWDAQARPFPADIEEGPDRQNDWTEQLLTLAAPALRLEPQLLRCLRLGMHRFGAQPPAVIEALCWQHPDIREPHNVAATFHSQARKERLQKFATLPPEEQRFALQQLRYWRQPLAEEIWFEELLNVEALLDKEAVFQGQERKVMEQDIQTGCAFLTQLSAQGKLADPACQAWAIRLESRMCGPAVQRGVAYRELQTIFSQLNPGQPTSRSGHALDPELLPSNEQPEQRVWLCQQGRRLVVARHVPTQVPQQHTSLLAALSYRRPAIKLVLSDDSSCSVDLPDPLTEQVQSITDAEEISLLEVRSIKTDLTELCLQALIKPKWASAVGQDCFGLYADLHIPCSQASRWSPSFGLGTGEKNLRQRFRWIPAGEFMMGSPPDEKERDGDEDYHQVTLTRGYWLADTAVTQAAWQAIIGRNPAEFQDDKFNPVEEVSWDNAQEFIAELNRRLAEAGGTEEGMLFRLPTEAEWEHACRAGTDTPFSFGKNITSEQVNYDGNHPYADGEKGKYREKTVPVKSLPPNPWGLYEMHGNVWEWCADSWEENLGEEAVSDPYNDTSGSDRVMRGGSWDLYGRSVRSAYRLHRSPDYRDDDYGFRLASGHKLRPHGSAQGKGAGTSLDKERTE